MITRKNSVPLTEFLFPYHSPEKPPYSIKNYKKEKDVKCWVFFKIEYHFENKDKIYSVAAHNSFFFQPAKYPDS